MSTLRLVSIQVGLPATRGEIGSRDPDRGEWTSAIFKEPVSGPVFLSLSGLAGDGQADRVSHGGPDRAVLMYGASHYPLWRSELGWPDFPHGAFGENFTVEGLDESTACIGDTFEVGEALVQVSQPRGPCWKISRRWQRPDLLQRVVDTGRSGWYCRVLQPGHVSGGGECRRVDHPCPAWSVGRIAALRHDASAPLEDLEFLAACTWLSAGWREMFADRAARRRAST